MIKMYSLNTSPWLVDLYNTVLEYKTDGFLVELGVGYTIGGEGRREEPYVPTSDEIVPLGSNTGELIDIGWSGIYVDPIKELCDEAVIRHQRAVDEGRLSVVVTGASDVDGIEVLSQGETFVPAGYVSPGFCFYEGRVVPTRVTSKILEENKCPSRFDIMSIDVEGYEDRAIKGIDFDRHRPRILIAEINKVSMDIIQGLLPSSYVLTDDDGLNAAWVDAL